MRIGWGTSLGLILGGAILAYLGVVAMLARVCPSGAADCELVNPWWQGMGLLVLGGLFLVAGLARLVKLWSARSAEADASR